MMKKNKLTAMIRTTGFPVSITAQMIGKKLFNKYGVFCPEKIIQPEPFLDE
ncbi:MAG: saccharopine dehydrogenase C-terminal domain-containing protein [Candidatus Thermoplasmatota archaeon]